MTPMEHPEETAALRVETQRLIRALDLLQVRKTPCGQSIPVAQAHTLMFLLEHEGAPHQRAIADHLGLDTSSAARIVQKLSARQLVKATSDPSDRRVRRVKLTHAGRAFAKELERSSLDLFARTLRQIKPELHSQIPTILREISRAINTL